MLRGTGGGYKGTGKHGNRKQIYKSKFVFLENRVKKLIPG